MVGIPKTIDNDINHIEKSFGFETSVTISSPIIRDAHNEAKGAFNGVAIIKLMGRDSGFIAASAVMAMPEINVVLVPEVEFELHGSRGLLQFIKNRIEAKHHCVIVVAEGAGQKLFEKNGNLKRDASGNVLHEDVGVFLKNNIKEYFNTRGIKTSIKYIDPSYIIRSAPANPSDSIFCNQLGLAAVHGAMAGKTGFVVGQRTDTFLHLRIPFVANCYGRTKKNRRRRRLMVERSGIYRPTNKYEKLVSKRISTSNHLQPLLRRAELFFQKIKL